MSTKIAPRVALPSASVIALAIAAGQRRAIDLQAHRPHERQHFLDDRVRHLGFADDVLDQRLRVRVVGHLAAQQPGQHLDAGERVLDLVRHHRGHFADRRQAIAQALALFDLFDVGEVLEEQRRADGSPWSSRTSDSV